MSGFLAPLLTTIGPMILSKIFGGKEMSTRELKKVTKLLARGNMKSLKKKYALFKGGMNLIPVGPREKLVNKYSKYTMTGKPILRMTDVEVLEKAKKESEYDATVKKLGVNPVQSKEMILKEMIDKMKDVPEKITDQKKMSLLVDYTKPLAKMIESIDVKDFVSQVDAALKEVGEETPEKIQPMINIFLALTANLGGDELREKAAEIIIKNAPLGTDTTGVDEAVEETMNKYQGDSNSNPVEPKVDLDESEASIFTTPKKPVRKSGPSAEVLGEDEEIVRENYLEWIEGNTINRGSLVKEIGDIIVEFLFKLTPAATRVFIDGVASGNGKNKTLWTALQKGADVNFKLEETFGGVSFRSGDITQRIITGKNIATTEDYANLTEDDITLLLSRQIRLNKNVLDKIAKLKRKPVTEKLQRSK